MAKQNINRGSAEGDGNGETLYVAFGKCISNFDELYSLKADLASPTFTGTVTGVTKAMVGLGSVDNDSSATIVTAARAAVTASDVGLGSVVDGATPTNETNVVAALDDATIANIAHDDADQYLVLDATDGDLKAVLGSGLPSGGGAPEGVDILSGGPVTATWVLQADGDGTCSWVASSGGGGDAQTASPLSQFAATTSAQLAGVISNETGSGALVFGTGPTLSNPVGLDSNDVGLGNVDNQSAATIQAGTTAANVGLGSVVDGATPTNAANVTQAITDITGLTDDASPASGDKFLIKNAGGDLQTVDFDNLPSGGGASSLADLSDVTAATDTNGFVLVSDGSGYEGRALLEADISDLQTYSTAADLAATTVDKGADLIGFYDATSRMTETNVGDVLNEIGERCSFAATSTNLGTSTTVAIDNTAPRVVASIDQARDNVATPFINKSASQSAVRSGDTIRMLLGATSSNTLTLHDNSDVAGTELDLDGPATITFNKPSVVDFVYQASSSTWKVVYPEEYLGVPGADNYILQSTTAGVRSWVALANADALAEAADEKTAAGVLVYPSHVEQDINYDTEGGVDNYTCSYQTKTWTLEMTTKDSQGNITLMTANDGGVNGPWTRTLTYNSDNLITNGGVWA